MKKFFHITSIILVAIIAGISTQNCVAQSGTFSVLPIPAKYQPSASDLAPYRQQAASAKNGAYDLTKSLPQGYVTDGSVDYTKYLQQGINGNANVILPNFPVLIGPGGISLKSNSIVVFDERSKLLLTPTDAPTYQMLKIFNVQNIKVYFPVLQGDRDKHTGTKGEWGMGISIAGASNIQIINPKVSNCWGDGIYLGKVNEGINKSISISYAQLDNNRRNGISIICVDGFDFISPLITNTNGAPPMAGIDIEPNDNDDEINNINLSNPITFNNSDYGMILELDRLTGKNLKNVNVKMLNHLDDGAKTGMCFLLAKEIPNGGYSGNVSIVNPTWKNNKKDGFTYVKSSQNGLKIKFSNIKVIKKDANGNEASDDQKLSDTKKSIKNQLNAVVQ